MISLIADQYLFLTSFSKIIERLIYTRLPTHIDMNRILVQEQFGSQSHYSTEQAAFNLINSIPAVIITIY